MALRVEGKIDVFIDKKGYPVGVLKLWENNKVINKKCLEIDNKSNVELLSGHSYKCNIKGWLNLKEIKTKEKTFSKIFLGVQELEIVDDYILDDSYKEEPESVQMPTYEEFDCPF